MHSIQRAVCVAAVLFSSPAFSAGKYKVTDVGAGQAMSVNNLGHVVGNDFDMNKSWIWKDGVTSNLGLPPGKTYSEARRISSSGVVVGGAWDEEDHGEAQTWTDLTPTAAGGLGGSFSVAYGVNASDTIVGVATDSGGVSRPVSYAGGAASLIAGLETVEGTAADISDSGFISGFAYRDGLMEAFRWKDGTAEFLGTLGLESFANAVNDSGQVVGGNQFSDQTFRGYIWSGGVMTDLGTLGGSSSTAFDINNAGQIVGWSRLVGGAAAYIYADGTMSNLNELIDPNSGWHLFAAFGINDRGQIVGQGFLDGVERGFLLTPVSGGVPEPATWAMFIAGFGLVGAVARRRLNSANA